VTRSGYPTRPLAHTDVVVVGDGLPALTVSLELARRGRAVVAVNPAAPEDALPELGLVLLGTGRPYSTLVRGIGRPAAQLVWAAGCESHLRLRGLLGAAGRECGYRARGSFLVGRERAEAEELAESEDMLRDDGFPGEFLDHYMLETRFDVSGFSGAYWAAEDAEVDLPELRLVVGQAAETAGVRRAAGPLRFAGSDRSGVRVETEAETVCAEALVVAADGAAVDLVPGLRPWLEPGRLARRTAARSPGAELPSGGRTASGHCAWRSEGDRIELMEWRGAAGPEESPGVADLAERLHIREGEILPGPASTRRPADGRPVVGRPPDSDVVVACGFGELPAGLAFAAARWIADAVASGNDPTPEPLRTARALSPPSPV
jgi:glycine/D-amino acid oxidase-like deaminating enzyme